jgi:hypothetical protein
MPRGTVEQKSGTVEHKSGTVEQTRPNFNSSVQYIFNKIVITTWYLNYARDKMDSNYTYI